MYQNTDQILNEELDNVYSQNDKIQTILIDAGEAILSFYKKKEGVQIQYKKDHSPVTEADIASNKIITKGLKAVFPNIEMLSEESVTIPYASRKNLDYIWLLDPLDGTKEFLNQTDEFSINLALIHRKKAVAGFIYLPVQKKLYYAFINRGSYEISGSKTTQMQCSSFSLEQEGLKVVVSRSHMDVLTRQEIDRLRKPQKIVLGSALKFLSIAKGEADYYPRMIHIMEWDTAAGQIIIEESGGSLEDALTGKPLEYNKATLTNPFFIASGKIV